MSSEHLGGSGRISALFMVAAVENDKLVQEAPFMVQVASVFAPTFVVSNPLGFCVSVGEHRR